MLIVIRSSFLIVAMLLAACQQDADHSAPIRPPATPWAVTGVPRLQLASTPAIAPTPMNFPNHSPSDVSAAFAEAARIAGATVHIFQWSDPHLMEVATYSVAEARQWNLTPLLSLSPTTLDKDRKQLDLPAILQAADASFKNEGVKRSFVETAVALARLKPPYLCLAAEINLLAFGGIEEYVYFATAYKAAYYEVKRVSPDTQVCVSFQYDYIRILDIMEPGKMVEHRKLIDIFRPELDVIAITSYPADHFPTPQAVPDNYYTYLQNYLQPSDKVIITEIGWPTSGPGTPEEQREFVARLPTLLKDLSPTVVAWALLHDVRLSAFGDNLATVGLKSREGIEKSGYGEWKKVFSSSTDSE